MRRLLIPILFACLSNSLFAQISESPAKISVREAQEDLDYLYQTLQESHYDLFVNTDKAVFDERIKQLKTNLKDSLDMLEFHRLVQPFTALSRLAHCSSEFPFRSHYGPYIQNRGTLFPFSVRIEGIQVFVSENYTDNIEISEGDEILQINSASIASVLQAMYRHLSGEGPYIKNSVIDQIEFARVYWLIYDEVSGFDLKLRRQSDGKTYEVSVEAKPAAEIEAHFDKKPSLFNEKREFKFIGDIAYLRPGIFMNQVSELNTSEHESFDSKEFNAFIDSSFARIKAVNSNQLIIDLRGNPGGDNSFSDYMLAYFADKPFWFCSEFYVKTSEITKQFWEGVEQENLQEMRRMILDNKNGTQFQVPFDLYAPRPKEDRYQGQVYVLINRYSYSNTVTTAAIIKDYGFGTLLGETTADTPSSFGAVHQFPLPHSKLNITYPKALMVRPNGSRELKGVEPDIFLKENRSNKEDEVLKATLEFIKSKHP